MKKEAQITYNEFEVTILELLDSIFNRCYESAEEISNDKNIIDYWCNHEKK